MSGASVSGGASTVHSCIGGRVVDEQLTCWSPGPRTCTRRPPPTSIRDGRAARRHRRAVERALERRAGLVGRELERRDRARGRVGRRAPASIDRLGRADHAPRRTWPASGPALPARSTARIRRCARPARPLRSCGESHSSHGAVVERALEGELELDGVALSVAGELERRRRSRSSGSGGVDRQRRLRRRRCRRVSVHAWRAGVGSGLPSVVCPRASRGRRSRAPRTRAGRAASSSGGNSSSRLCVTTPPSGALAEAVVPVERRSCCRAGTRSRAGRQRRLVVGRR